jgi:hypothetical protein
VACLAGCRTAALPAGVPVSARSQGAAVRGSAATGTPAAPPDTEQGCRTCNGVWDVHGIATTKSCNCRTRDGGKRCRDGADCQGMCIAADEPEREVVDKGPPPRGYFVGRCSDLVTVYGCNRLIDRGAGARPPVPLAEPPPQMCVD